MLIEMLRWWYGPGWANAAKRIKTRSLGVAQSFSMGTLFKTLFAPWKRIQYSGKSFDAKMQAVLDNLISRMVGMTVRFGVLFGAIVATSGTFAISVIIVCIWPLVPLLIIYSILRGII